ncbi:MAG: T9SS type A sorting domain-containing protein [Bacteroidota bacterium]
MSTCIGSSFRLPFNLSIDTIFTGSGIVNDYYFDSNISGVGTFSISFNSLCGKTAIINMTVHPNPPTPQIINPIITCCLGHKIPMTASPSGGFFQSGVVFNDTLFTEFFQQDILFGDSGRAIIEYGFSDTNGCTSFALDTIYVEYAYSPNSPISSCPNTTFSLTGYPSGGAFSGASISGNTYTAPSSIGYDYGYYTYTYPSGCQATYTLNLSTYNCVGIQENIKDNIDISIYPNPANDKIYLNILNYYPDKSYNVKVSSIAGKLLRTFSLKENSAAMEISELANGIYLVEVAEDKIIYRSKFVISR